MRNVSVVSIFDIYLGTNLIEKKYYESASRPTIFGTLKWKKKYSCDTDQMTISKKVTIENCNTEKLEEYFISYLEIYYLWFWNELLEGKIFLN